MKISKKIEFWKLNRKYQQHAFDKTFDLDWGTIGYNRIALVNLLISEVGGSECDYLEIGCEFNKLFDSVACSNKIGVDPNRGGNVRKTSDDFFKSNTKKFDVIFIDGLHHYEQVHKDIQNAVRCLKKGGWIALHDLHPRDWKEQHVPALKRTWTGDTWKVAFELVETVGAEFKILRADHGLGILKVTGEAVEIPNKHDELVDAQFDYFCGNMNSLPIVDWDEAVQWIKSYKK